MHIPSLCLRSPIIIGTPSPLAAYFESLFFHQSALQLNIEKSYVGPMSSKDEPQRRLAIVESFLRHDFTSLFNLTVRRKVRLCRNTSCGCTPTLIAPDKNCIGITALVAIYSSLCRHNIILLLPPTAEVSRISALRALAGCEETGLHRMDAESKNHDLRNRHEFANCLPNTEIDCRRQGLPKPTSRKVLQSRIHADRSCGCTCACGNSYNGDRRRCDDIITRHALA